MVGLGDLRRGGVAVGRGGRRRGSGRTRRFKERGSSGTGRRRGVGIGVRQEEGEKSKWDGGGHCEKNTSGAIINLPLLKPHNEMVQWNH